MFLTAVDEKETMVIGNTCKNKTSTDFNEMGMTIVKSFTDRISKPLTHFCSLSVQTSTFPNKMKIAEVKSQLFSS